MARQYVVTEEEFMALLDGLALEKFELRESSSRMIGADGKPDVTRMHKAFHHRVINWVQEMGFKGYRG